MNTAISTLSDASAEEIDFDRRFGGIARLYGVAALQRFRTAHVCVIGVGGVGSWAVEALARSAVGQLTMIDLDHVAESNINRQIQALTATLGKAKVTALAERIAQINPFCRVIEVEGNCETGTQGVTGLNCAGFGSAMVVTATFGLVAAAQVLRRLAANAATSDETAVPAE